MNRRAFLLSGAVVAAGAGGLYAVQGRSDTASTGANSVSGMSVPPDIHRLVQLDWGDVLRDDPAMSGITPLLEELQVSSPASVLASSSEGKQKTLLFGGGDSAGAVVWTDWGEDLPLHLGWERDSLTERTHAGETVYTTGNLAAARLDDGVIGIGTQATVATLLERWTGTVTEAAGVVSTHTTASREAEVRFSLENAERARIDRKPLDQRLSSALGSLQRTEGDILLRVHLTMELPEHTDAVVSNIESAVFQLLCSTGRNCESRRAVDETTILDTNRQFSAADIEYRAPVEEFSDYGGTVLRGTLRGMTGEQ